MKKEPPSDDEDYTSGQLHGKTHVVTFIIVISLIAHLIGWGIGEEIFMIIVIGSLAYLTASIFEDSVESKLQSEQYLEGLADRIADTRIGPDSSGKVQHVLNNIFSGLVGVLIFFGMLVVEMYCGNVGLAVGSVCVILVSGLIARNVGENSLTETTEAYFDTFVLNVGVILGFLLVLLLFSVFSMPEPDSGYTATVALLVVFAILLVIFYGSWKSNRGGSTAIQFLVGGVLIIIGLMTISALILQIEPLVRSII